MYLQNKYTKWYYSIINRALFRTINTYTEKHHIIPRCIGGSNNGDNLVKLTYREHRLCHILLPYMVETQFKGKMWRAAKAVMVISSPNHQRTESKGRFAEKARIEAVNSRRGIPRSSETVNKIKLSKSLNPTVGRPVKDETRAKLSLALKGRPHSKEWNEKVSIALRLRPGKAWTDESKIKASRSHSKPKKKSICPHCGLVGSQNGLTRYHFDKCSKIKSNLV